MTIERLNTQQTSEKAKLRSLIGELTERMVRALDDPGGKSEEQGKETASFSNIKSCLDTVCSVYRLLNGTGDLDESGSALLDYQKEMNNGRANQGRR